RDAGFEEFRAITRATTARAPQSARSKAIQPRRIRLVAEISEPKTVTFEPYVHSKVRLRVRPLSLSQSHSTRKQHTAWDLKSRLDRSCRHGQFIRPVQHGWHVRTGPLESARVANSSSRAVAEQSPMRLDGVRVQARGPTR